MAQRMNKSFLALTERLEQAVTHPILPCTGSVVATNNHRSFAVPALADAVADHLAAILGILIGIPLSDSLAKIVMKMQLRRWLRQLRWWLRQLRAVALRGMMIYGTSSYFG